MRRLATFGFIAILLAMGILPASASIVVGNRLIDRPVTDTAIGGVFVLGKQPSEAIGGSVAAWSFFDDATGGATQNGRLVTPLILTKSGSQFTIVGIGATRATDRSGVQSFDFDLFAGASLIGPNSYLGWRDGGLAATSVNQGVIEFTYEAPGTEPYTGIVYRSNLGTITVGTQFTPSLVLNDRTYSVQYVVIPEPSTIVVWSLLATLGLGAVAWRKKAARD